MALWNRCLLIPILSDLEAREVGSPKSGALVGGPAGIRATD